VSTGEIEVAGERDFHSRLTAASAVITGEHPPFADGMPPPERRHELPWSAEEEARTAGRGPVIADEAFRNRLKWVTAVRILVVSLMLAATVVLPGEGASAGIFEPNALRVAYMLAICMYVASAFYIVVLLKTAVRRTLFTLTVVQLAMDLFFAAGIVLLTGGTGSVFSFFFSLAVVTAALVLYRRGAVVMATCSFLSFMALGLLELSPGLREALTPALEGLLPPEALTEAASNTTGYNIAVNAIAFYAIAFLASFLSEQLRAADLRLRAQATTIENLEELFNNIISSIPIGVITTDSAGHISFMNPEALAFGNMDPSAALNRPVARLFPDLRHILANRDKHGRVVSEITSQLIGREVRLLRWTITPLGGREGSVEGELFIFEDITSVVSLEKAMQESRHLAAIGKLAAGVAHEIRNPLGAISGCVQMMRRRQGDSAPDSEQARMMDIIVRETEHLNHWVGEFLAYARPRPPELAPVDLVRAANDTVLLARQDSALVGEARVELEGRTEAWVRADAGQLSQVLWNLVQNALQALKGSAEAAVTVRIHQDSGTGGGWARFSVKDNGPGIPEDEKSAVFEPFFTTRERGTGLGLATVHRIVQNHGGRIRVRSELGRGTTFEVILPAALPQVPAGGGTLS